MRAARILLLLILLLVLLACLAPFTPGLRWLSGLDKEVPAPSQESRDVLVRLLPVFGFIYFLIAIFLPRLRLLLPHGASGDSTLLRGPGIGVVRTRGGWRWYEVVSGSRWKRANFFHCYGAAIICAGMAYEAWVGVTNWAAHMPSNFGLKLAGIGLVFIVIGLFEPGPEPGYRVVWLPQGWWGRKRHPSLSQAASRRHAPARQEL